MKESAHKCAGSRALSLILSDLGQLGAPKRPGDGDGAAVFGWRHGGIFPELTQRDSGSLRSVHVRVCTYTYTYIRIHTNTHTHTCTHTCTQ